MRILKHVFVCAFLFSITACGASNGEEIGKERAEEIATYMKEHPKEMVAREIIASSITYTGDPDSGNMIQIKHNCQIKENANGERYQYMKTSNKIDGEKIWETYVVKNEEYEEVTCQKQTKKPTSGNYTEYAAGTIVKKNNSSYEEQSEERINNADFSFNSYYNMDCDEAFGYFDQAVSSAESIGNSGKVTYYSTSSNELTLKLSCFAVSKNIRDNYDIVSSQGIITLKENRLILCEATTKLKNGLKTSISLKVSYSDTAYKINLPSGWENYMI